MAIVAGNQALASDVLAALSNFVELDGSLTWVNMNNGWIDWDLSGTIPAGAKAVLFQISGNGGNMRANGSALAKTTLVVVTTLISECDTNRVVEVNTFAAGSNTTFSIWGYWREGV